MAKKQMICNSVDICNVIGNTYHTKFYCAHNKNHDFRKPQAMYSRHGSCLERECYNVNRKVKCVPAPEEEIETILEEKGEFKCPIGYESGFQAHDPDCVVCDLIEPCIEFFNEPFKPEDFGEDFSLTDEEKEDFECPLGYRNQEDITSALVSAWACADCPYAEVCDIISY